MKTSFDEYNTIKNLFKERYTITKDGRVFSNFYVNKQCNKKLEKPKELKTTLTSKGYKRITLRHDGRSVNFFVHRIVAFYFLGPPNEKHLIVGHLNDVSDDNRVENLKWMSMKENAEYARINGRLCEGVLHGNASLTKNDIKNILEEKELGRSIYFLSKKYNLAYGNMKNLIKGISYKKEREEALNKIKSMIEGNGNGNL